MTWQPTCVEAGRCDVRARVERCASDRVCTPEACVAPPPPFDDVPFKGIQPDVDVPAGPNRVEDIAGNNSGRVAINLTWFGMQCRDCARLPTPPCAQDYLEYEGACFNPAGLSARRRDFMRAMTDRGVRITGILHFPPDWAHAGGCPDGHTCAPDRDADFARFASFAAWYWRGPASPGGAQIDDFVVWNEANRINYFNLGDSGEHDKAARADRYARLFWAAADAIRRRRPRAKVYVSLSKEFGPTETHVDGWMIIDRVARLAAGRPWHVAIHPYPARGFLPEYSASDEPLVTIGTLGRLTGELEARHGRGHDVLITEFGLRADGPGGEEQQSQGICAAYRQALATPGVTGFIYHRYIDVLQGPERNLRFGLRRENGALRRAWLRWARMDREPLGCGFELGDRLILTRHRREDGFYWTTTRRHLSEGYVTERTTWRIFREPGPGRHALYDCRRGNDDHFLSGRADCEGRTPWGAVGYVWSEGGGDRRPIWRCLLRADQGRHIISPDPTCERPDLWQPEGDRPLGWGE